jgi:hypothetical protein
VKRSEFYDDFFCCAYKVLNRLFSVPYCSLIAELRTQNELLLQQGNAFSRISTRVGIKIHKYIEAEYVIKDKKKT